MKLSEPCGICGRDADVAVGEHVGVHAIVWSKSLRCRHCGNALEEDGEAIAYLYRDELLRKEGVWTLQISSSHRLAAMKIAREMRSMDLAEAKRFVAEPRGTLAEMEMFRRALARQGIETGTDSIRRLYDQTDSPPPPRFGTFNPAWLSWQRGAFIVLVVALRPVFARP